MLSSLQLFSFLFLFICTLTHFILSLSLFLWWMLFLFLSLIIVFHGVIRSHVKYTLTRDNGKCNKSRTLFVMKWLIWKMPLNWWHFVVVIIVISPLFMYDVDDECDCVLAIDYTKVPISFIAIKIEWEISF